MRKLTKEELEILENYGSEEAKRRYRNRLMSDEELSDVIKGLNALKPLITIQNN